MPWTTDPEEAARSRQRFYLFLTAQNPATHGTVTLAEHACNLENESSPIPPFAFQGRSARIPNNSRIGGLRRLKIISQDSRTYMPHWDKGYVEHLLNIFIWTGKEDFQAVKGMTSMITIIVALASKSGITCWMSQWQILTCVCEGAVLQNPAGEVLQRRAYLCHITHIIEEATDLFEERLSSCTTAG